MSNNINYKTKLKSNLDLEIQKEKTKQLELIKEIKKIELYISKQNIYKKNNNMLEIFDKINSNSDSNSDSDSDSNSNSESELDTNIDINLDSISISSENSIDTCEEVEIKL
jgi:hypothetical protein